MILVTAHRELEKAVLTKWQRFQKDRLADFYGMLLHEGQHFDPVMREHGGLPAELTEGRLGQRIRATLQWEGKR